MGLIHDPLVDRDRFGLKPIWIIFVFMASWTFPVTTGAEKSVPAFALLDVYRVLVISCNKHSPLQTAAL